MKVIVKKRETKKINIPAGSFYSDWFKCRNCEYTIMMKIHPNTNTAKCSKCGGTMVRL